MGNAGPGPFNIDSPYISKTKNRSDYRVPDTENKRLGLGVLTHKLVLTDIKRSVFYTEPQRPYINLQTGLRSWYNSGIYFK